MHKICSEEASMASLFLNEKLDGEETGMKRLYGKTLTLAILVAIMAGSSQVQASNWDEWSRDAHGGEFDNNNNLNIDEDTTVPHLAGGYAGVSFDGYYTGHVRENSVSITNGTVKITGGKEPYSAQFWGGGVAGGAGRAEAWGNQVTVSGQGKIIGDNYQPNVHGGIGTEADYNSVSIKDHGALVNVGNVNGGCAYGMYTHYKADYHAYHNEVDFESDGISSIHGDICGGWAEKASGENKVTFNNGTISLEGDIIGGNSRGGNSSDARSFKNSVFVRNKAELHIDGEIIGGDGDSSATQNQVVIATDKPVTGTVAIMGGAGETSKHNLVSIQNSSIESGYYIAGGEGAIDCSKNTVILGGKATVSALGITGGFIYNDEDDGGQYSAEENLVSLDSPASVTAVAVGGGAAINASRNFLDLKGTVHGYLLAGAGACNENDYFKAGSSTVTGNVVNLAGAKLVPIKLDDPLIKDYTESEDYKPYVGLLKKPGESIHVGGGALLVGGKAKDNTVNLSGTMDLSQANLYGWITGPELLENPSELDELLEQNLDTTVDHSGNTLNVGYTAEMTTDKAGNSSITGKAADWHGSKVQGIYNFDKIAFYNVDHSQPALTVTDTVSLPDNVKLDLDHFTPSSSPEDSVIKDDVLIDASGASAVKGLDKLYESGKDKYQQSVTRTYVNGGVTVTGKDGLALSNDNKLYYGLHSLDDITYKTIDWKTGGTVLTLADSQKFDLADTKVHTEDIGFTAKSLETITKAGDYAMTLLDTQGNKTLSAGNLTTKKGTWNVGNALEGTGEASLDKNGNVVYHLDTVEKHQTPEQPEIKVDASKQTHNALIANEAALGTLAAGRDRMEGVLDTFNGQEGGVFTFASIGGSKDKYDTGSQSSTYTWNGLAGVGNDVALKNGDFSYGIFYEYGKGHYDVDGAGYTGSGDAHYSGGGLMAKYVARNKNYGEASLHFGQLKNNADSVLHSRGGSAYGYDTSSNYWSGHVGFGHIFDLTNQTASTSRGGTERASRDLDVYGKYFYTHVGGDNFHAGDADYQLDDLNSNLMRIGARLNNRSGRNDYYCGLAWDYEFEGESNGTVSAAGLSARIREADIGGSSMMAEAGWKLEATNDSPWDVDLSVRAYAGQHKGIGGNLFVGYHF